MLEWRKISEAFWAPVCEKAVGSCYSSSETWQLLFIPKKTVSCNHLRLQHLNVYGAGPILYCPPKIRKIKSRDPRWGKYVIVALSDCFPRVRNIRLHNLQPNFREWVTWKWSRWRLSLFHGCNTERCWIYGRLGTRRKDLTEGWTGE